MKSFSSLVRISLLAALLAATNLSATPVPPAHAAAAAITVTTEADEFNYPIGNNTCSLREAIANADANSTYPDCSAGSSTESDVIVFADYVNNVSLGNSLQTTDPAGLTIDGDGHVTIQGDYQHRLLTVSNAPLTLRGLTLAGGYVAPQYGGGAIWNDHGNLAVSYSTFYDNEAGWGGAIFNEGTLSITNSLFWVNAAVSGGGGAVFTQSGNTTLINNTFRWNSAVSGADLYIYSNGATLYNNLFAESLGGGHCQAEAGQTATGYRNLFQHANSACPFSLADNLLGIDPLLGNGQDWWVPSTNSRVIDAAASDTCPFNLVAFNDLTRPQGIRCDIGAYEYPQTLVQARFYSSAVEDGWVLESGETSGVGGTKNNTATTLRVGDDAQNRQYRAILSFDATPFPENTPIAWAQLWFKPISTVGKLPFTKFGNLLVDIRTRTFGSSPTLQLADFKATANYKGMVIPSTLYQGWYMQELYGSNLQYINVVSGLTQFRLRFAKDDNNDFGADYLKIVSGDGDDEVGLPQLILYYYVR